MRASYDTYRSVAKNCSEFVPVHEIDSFSSSVKESDTNISCINCQNFDNDKHCVLDLFDKIASK